MIKNKQRNETVDLFEYRPIQINGRKVSEYRPIW